MGLRQNNAQVPSRVVRLGSHTVLAVCLAMAGVVTREYDKKPRPGVEALAVIWNTMSSSQQHTICTSIKRRGVKAVARQMARERKSAASVGETERFLQGLACHIEIHITTG